MKEIDSRGRFGVPYQWIDRTIGIHERRVAPDDITFAEMAAAAGQEAMEEAGLQPEDIGAILYCGIDRDYLEPATAHLVQDRLGAGNAICFDLTNACHGFMNGVHVVDALVATGQIRHGLIVTAERNFRITREAIRALQATTDRDVFVNLVGGLTVGDAGAALVAGPKTKDEAGFVGFMLQSRGEFNDLCVFKNRDQDNDATGHMVMTRIVREHLKLHADMYPDFMRRLHWSPGDIAKFVHHQVGRKAFKMHAEYSHVPLQSMPDTVSWLGNIASATIPVNLHYLRREGSVQPRQKVFISAAGSGLSISQTGLVWDEAA
jgi:3-oxoacyl-[acyl-carrier-protein] synthase-3